MADLQIAVTICSIPVEVFLTARFERSKLRSMFWSWRCSKMSLHDECQKFVTYVDDYNSPPEVWHDQTDAGDGKMGAPWVLANATFLIRHTTFTPHQVWTMPIGMALWYSATIAEQLGSKVQIPTEEERAALKALGH